LFVSLCEQRSFGASHLGEEENRTQGGWIDGKVDGQQDLVSRKKKREIKGTGV